MSSIPESRCKFCGSPFKTASAVCDCTTKTILISSPDHYVGLLDTRIEPDDPLDKIRDKQIAHIESRILKIEEALRQIGINLP